MYDESNLKFATHNNLDKRCCDVADNCDNTQTLRELIIFLFTKGAFQYGAPF